MQRGALDHLRPDGLATPSELDQFATLCRRDWPDVVSIERAGFFNRGPVRRLVLRLTDHAFVAWSDGTTVVHEIGGVSLGVVVRTQRTDPTDWVTSLHREFGHQGRPASPFRGSTS